MRLSSAQYLADLDTLRWKGFPNRHGEKGDFGKIGSAEKHDSANPPNFKLFKYFLKLLTGLAVILI